MPQKQADKGKTIKNPPKRTGSTTASTPKVKTDTSSSTAVSQKTKSGAKVHPNTPPDPKMKTPRSDRPAPDPSSIPNQVVPYLLGFIALFLTICYILEDKMGIFGQGVNALFFGLFSGAAILIPLFILIIAITWRRDIVKRTVRYKIFFSSLLMIFISALIFIATRKGDDYDIKAFWTLGREWISGGVVGGTIGWLMLKAVGDVGTVIISIAMIFLFGVFMFGLTPYGVWVFFAYHVHEWNRRRKEEHELKKQPVYHVKPLPADNAPEPEPLPGSLTEPARQQPEPAHRHPSANRKPIKIGADTEIDVPDSEKTQQPEENPVDAGLYDELLRQTHEEAEEDIKDAVRAENTRDNTPRRPVRHAFDRAEEAAEQSDLNTSDLTVSDTENEDTDDEVIEPSVTDNNTHSDTVKAEKVTPKTNKADDFSEVFEDEAGPLSEEIIKKLTQPRESSPDDIKAETPELEVQRTTVETAKQPESTVVPKPEYVFPPVSLLNMGEMPKNDDISEELQTTAKRLVDTLTSFKVRTRVVNVSRGPTITRYELAPDEGIRVRQIINLVDDISLNLATSGVRIEAPIPGKQAVGIEVPNRVVATVWLRRLIENPKFLSAKSKLTVCLGEDVAGEPVYVDIAKMPHLLIAGATGMGKSVCINSMIVSLLYKATPEEVKLILVDPKKVELNIYNGLPHLLVPVVSDPKKAAGSLAWAVTEMERRFTLIEEVGMRDLKGYNDATKDDPEKEFLPQIVIIIDELADLMMMAKDNVEESICRLAQKARAAGMHLIIGTQRPSVDVVTGLIKANVPSRIAFTMASQVDSRTIIDISGAEKLIGRGDMLYAPVGNPKPIRVQGSYVAEKEIDDILDYIKSHFGTSEYNDDVMSSIEREAAKCVSKKESASSSAGIDEDDGEEDSMLRPAIELAIESGKISTSLIQRRLQLGYGRAAKLIDRMEQKGFVSAPEGQKPRNVLITKQEYMEMILRQNDIE